ncbi:hypothetical protein G7Z17_g6370 [Cylindrodendrum hubeiense]|uniref:Uncharacterized protein n=1 Tax=Cylindrodendrum hubeiense TaxID=595255 RepID=A0A9P5HCG1_9HYPO|nr:hypothetical protein G7Z17_g6370 [Cylindrodendrum hubeiense]
MGVWTGSPARARKQEPELRAGRTETYSAWSSPPVGVTPKIWMGSGRGGRGSAMSGWPLVWIWSIFVAWKPEWGLAEDEDAAVSSS